MEVAQHLRRQRRTILGGRAATRPNCDASTYWIAGEVEPGQDGDVHITADAKALDAFMQSPRAGKLFNKSLIALSRVE